jgi:hypothetical protein
MQSSRFDFDVISGPVPPRIPPKPAPSAPQSAPSTPPKQETGR